MILGFLFSIQTFLKHGKALSTEKYMCYINIFYFIYYSRLSYAFQSIWSVPKLSSQQGYVERFLDT